METLVIYELVVPHAVADVVKAELDKYHQRMSRPTINLLSPTEFRVPGLITIENLKIIRNCSEEKVLNPRYEEPTVRTTDGNFPGKFDQDSHHPYLSRITIEVYQVIKL